MIGRKMYEILDLRELQGPPGIVIENVVYQQQQEYMNKGRVPEAILVTRDQWEAIKVYYEPFEEMVENEAVKHSSLFGTPVWVAP